MKKKSMTINLCCKRMGRALADGVITYNRWYCLHLNNRIVHFCPYCGAKIKVKGDIGIKVIPATELVIERKKEHGKSKQSNRASNSIQT